MSAILRKYGVALTGGYKIRIPMLKAGTSDQAVGSDWTPAIGDVKVSIDGGTEANIATLPSYSQGAWEFVHSTGEVTGKQISIRIVDSATKAVSDNFYTIETFGHASAMYPNDMSTASPTPPTNFGLLSIDSSGRVTVISNADKSGYSLTQAFPSNFASLAINGTGQVTVGTLAAAAILSIWTQLTSGLTTASTIGKLFVDNLNATITSRMASFTYTAPLDASGTRAAVGLATANLDTQFANTATIDSINTVNTNVLITEGKVDTVQSSVSAISIPTANQCADALLDRADAIETGWTLRMVMRVLGAFSAGDRSGFSGSSPIIKSLTGAKTRISSSNADADGNATITKDGTP